MILRITKEQLRTASKYKPVCFVCGSEDVEWTQEFDHFCSETLTTSCICEACGASWYDDNAPTTIPRESEQPILGEG